MQKIVIFCLSLFFFFSCKESGDLGNLKDLDLMSYGMPIKIKAPENSEIKSDDLGLVKEVSIKNGENYHIQIFSGQSYTSDLKSLLEAQKGDVVTMTYFSQIIEEFENGFIFEKKYPEMDNKITYDFRYLKKQGDNQFIFQTGLMGNFTLAQVKEMYNAVKN